MKAPITLTFAKLACWLGVVAMTSIPARAGLVNGGFEMPAGVQTYTVFGVGSSLPGWTVESGTVEVVGPYWQAAEGCQSLDLNGIYEEIGTIYQDVATEPGERYRIRFAFAGNPEGAPAIKSMKVYWAGAELDTLQFDITGHSVTNMGWKYREYEVTATTATSRLRFQSTSSGFCGPTLDKVSVTPVVAPPLPPPPPLPPSSHQQPPPRVMMEPGHPHELTIEGEAGQHYRIEFCESLLGGQWQPLTNLCLPSSLFKWSDLGVGNAPQRFYRVVPTQ